MRDNESSDIIMLTDGEKPPKRHLGGLLTDVLIGILLFLVYGILKATGKPHVRGFFCNDNSINYPYFKDTIPTSLLIILGTIIPVVVIVFVECLNHFSTAKPTYLPNSIDCKSSPCKTKFWILRVTERIGYTALGGVVSQIVTDTIKLMSGVLRPSFLAVCKPNKTILDCSKGFITDDVCTGNVDLIEFSRKSFPSGHASFSAYSMIFVALYLQYTIHTEKIKLLKPLSQLIALMITIACCITRATDYAHHNIDITFGFLIGMLLAFFVVFCLLKLPKEEKLSRTGAVILSSPKTESPNKSKERNCPHTKKLELRTCVGSKVIRNFWE